MHRPRNMHSRQYAQAAQTHIVLVCFAKGRGIHELTISAKASYRSAKPASSTSFTRASGARPAITSRCPCQGPGLG